jgi:hypothetical protein
VEGDAGDPVSSARALDGCRAAIYLVEMNEEDDQCRTW